MKPGIHAANDPYPMHINITARNICSQSRNDMPIKHAAEQKDAEENKSSC